MIAMIRRTAVAGRGRKATGLPSEVIRDLRSEFSNINAREKYSGGPSGRAKLARLIAKSIRPTTPKVRGRISMRTRLGICQLYEKGRSMSRRKIRMSFTN